MAVSHKAGCSLLTQQLFLQLFALKQIKSVFTLPSSPQPREDKSFLTSSSCLSSYLGVTPDIPSPCNGTWIWAGLSEPAGLSMYISFQWEEPPTTLDVRGLDCYFMKHVHCVLSCFSCVQSLCLCGLWPTRLLSPWGSPGKNTGVGSHLLLQGIFPTHKSKLCLLCLPALAGGFLTIRASWEAPYEAHMKSKFSSETSMFKSNM